MSSYIRRIERMPKRRTLGAIKRMFTMHIGDKVGVSNPKAADKLAREAREWNRLNKG